MNFAAFPHIRDLYDNLAETLVLQGSVQCFKSEFAVVDHLAMAHSGLSVFFVVPKHDMKVSYVQNRINKCVQTVPKYKEIVGDGFFDSVLLKSFGKGTIKYVGSNVKADFTEFPADAIVVEEVDQCNAENVNYALDRIRASPYQFKRYLGNPSEPNRGINKYFMQSDQREWHVPCFGCGRLIKTDWFNTVVRTVKDSQGEVIDYALRDTEWERGCGRDVNMICTHCDGRLLRESRKGKWIPTNLDGEFTGYHISMLDSLINDISGMWSRFQQATIDAVLLKQFYNSDLGLPFAAAGNKITTGLLDNCRIENYDFTLNEDSGHRAEDRHPGPCSMGVDVGSAFDVRISYVTPRSRIAMFMGKVRHLDDLYDLIERYNVQVAVIDAEPEATLAEEFQNDADIPVWRCKYRPSEGAGSSMSLKENDMLINIDRTAALDKSFLALKRKKNKLPDNYSKILDGEYESEMCMPVREAIETGKGVRRFIWTKGKDHQRHADTYDMLAAELMESEDISVEVG